MMTSPCLVLPPPPGSHEQPIWTGGGFLVGQSHCRVLAYGGDTPGWTDSLTAFHEGTAGRHHYIDIASRAHTLTQLTRWLTPDEPLLMDIGCSSGFMLSELGRRFPRAIVVGADCVLPVLERLGGRMPDVPLLQFDLSRCPLPDGCVDGVVLLNVLEHVEDDTAALHHVARILRPGGVAVIEVPAGPSLFDIYDRQLLHKRRYRMRDLLRAIRATGLQVVHQSHLGFFLYPGFWFVKKRGRRYLAADDQIQQDLLRLRIQRSGRSAILRTALDLESVFRPLVYYPFGIRCLVTCRKLPDDAPGDGPRKLSARSTR